MLRILSSVCLLCASAMTMAGEVKYDSIYDKFPIPDADYTADGEFFQMFNDQRNLVGLEPPFTLASTFVTVDETPNESYYHIGLRIEVRLADANGFTLKYGPRHYNELYIAQEAGADLARFVGQIDGVDITPINLNVSIHDIESYSLRVNEDDSTTAFMKVKGAEAEIALLTIPAPFENTVLYSWSVATTDGVWLDTVTLSGPNVVDRNGGKDVHKFRDSNGDGEINAVDVQFIINAVLGIGK